MYSGNCAQAMEAHEHVMQAAQNGMEAAGHKRLHCSCQVRLQSAKGEQATS